MSSRTYRRQRRSRGGSREGIVRKRQNNIGLWLLLVVVLLAMGGWALLRTPPDLLHQIEVGGIVLLLVLVLLIVSWFVLRSRLTQEEQAEWQKQKGERQLADETSLAVGTCSINLADLRYLTYWEEGR